MRSWRQEVTKNQKNVTCMMIDNSFEWMVMKLRKKVLTFKGIINFLSCDKVGLINEVYF
ncbi:unnamed protein product, partial [Vitis vinifera]|uniref:Uncharacterized protein n=1 Tax=Vitis vinifera TaxID=29760 RepID=D7UAW2_VITVI